MTGFEPLIAAATVGLTSLITETVKTSGGKFLGLFDYDLSQKAKELIFEASGKYVENYAKRHGLIKVLGMREPVILESVYTTIQMLDSKELRNFQSAEDLENSFRKSKKRRYRIEAGKKYEGIEVANQHQYLMVLGHPGSGKSTFLRKIGLEALKGKNGRLKHDCIPVLIELKKFRESEIDIKDIIKNEFKICGFPNPVNCTKATLEKGKLLILFDGLDEVPSANLNNVIEIIQDFVDQYSQNRYIASCRIAAYQYNFQRFTDVVIADFNDKQIQQFIHNWFQSKKDQETNTAESCWQLLQNPENAAAKELAHTPLLLTFLCLVYDRSQNFPNNRSALYKKALRILLEEWASEKRIFREEIYQGLNTELEETLLSEIAYESFTKDRLFLHQSEVVSQIKEFLSSNSNAPQNLSGEKVLDAIAIHQGILVERAEDIYSFSHLTLQEYLVALYIKENNQIETIVKQHILDRRWREVFLLVSGLITSGNGAESLLLSMLSEAKIKINVPKLKAIFRWIKHVECLDNKKLDSNISETIAQRALMFHWLLFFEKKRALERTVSSEHTRALSLSLTIVSTLVSGKGVDSHLSTALEVASSSDLELDIDLALELSKSHSLPEFKELGQAIEKVRKLSENPNLIYARKSATNLAQDLEKFEKFVNLLPRDFTLTSSFSPEQTVTEVIEVQQVDGFIERTESYVSALDRALNHPGIKALSLSNVLVDQLNQARKSADEFLGYLTRLKEFLKFGKETINRTDESLKSRLNDIRRNISNQEIIQVLSSAQSSAQEFSHIISNVHNLARNYAKELDTAIENAFGLARSNTRQLALNLAFSGDRTIALELALDNALESFSTLENAYEERIYDRKVYLSSSGGEYCLELSRSLKRALDLAIGLTSNYNLRTQLQDMRTKVPTTTQSSETRKKFAERLWNICIEAFNLDLNLLNLTQDEIATLENYLYIIDLIIKCKQSSVRVPTQAWDSIQLQMFSL
jgi:hypothetical protein